MEVLRSLDALGIGIILDDFGPAIPRSRT